MLKQQFVNFLILGSIYSIIALGYTLYFGTIGLINFAHGDLCTLCAFFFLIIIQSISDNTDYPTHWMFLFAALAAISFTVFVGVMSERVLFRHIRGQPPLLGLVVSISFSTMIREGILRFYPNGANPQAFPDPFRSEAISLLGVSITRVQIALIAICFILCALFYVIIRKTGIGRVMRAISQDSEAAVMLGLPVTRTIAWTFGIGAAFAGIAGLFNGAIYGSVKFDMGLSFGIKGFVAAAAGGLGNPNGAIGGGMLLASIEISIIALAPNGSAYRDIVGFGLLLCLLIFRPEGLFGGKSCL